MNSTQAATRPQSTGRSTWVLGGVLVVVLVVIAVAAVVLSSAREDATYLAGSPEAALQEYFHAWRSGDIEAAYAALSSRAQARVPRDEFRDARRWQGESRVRVWIDERTEIADRVGLDLTLEEAYDGLLRPARDTMGLRVTMIRQDGDWKIDTPLVGYYPW
jgi:hypothetical protein